MSNSLCENTKKNIQYIMKKITHFASFLCAILLLTQAPLHSAEQKTIVAVASDAGQFNTLVTAIKAAGLVETLNGKGPFTVFAPTDEAFAKLPKGTVEDLLKPENKERLVAVLTYHVVPGKIMASDVVTTDAKTVNGKKLPIKLDAGKVEVGKANVVKADVPASNGVIHVVDGVLIP